MALTSRSVRFREFGNVRCLRCGHDQNRSELSGSGRISATESSAPGIRCTSPVDQGINHNGELANAFALIDQAAAASCDTRSSSAHPKITPRDRWDMEGARLAGRMTTIDYRHRN